MGGAPLRDGREGSSKAASHGAVSTTERIQALRRLMKHFHSPLDAYVVPTDDAHGSEYVATADERRAFISGFTGSAGTAIITHDQAYLFTDGRYFLQAEKQLDDNWTLMRRGAKGVHIPLFSIDALVKTRVDVPTWQDFLSQLPKGSRIGIDPTLIGVADAKTIRKALGPLESVLVQTDQNLVDKVWGSDQPARTANPILIHPLKYAGKSVADKFEALRHELVSKKCQAIVISALDEVAWLLNIRGSDIAYNPVAFSYFLLTEHTATLFAQPKAVSKEVQQYLADNNVEVASYDDAIERLRDAGTSFTDDKKVLVSEGASLAVAEAIGLHRVEPVISPVAVAKAAKNDVELEGFRQCHIRDGAALCAYFAWLQERLEAGAKLDEAQAADQLEEYRSRLDLFRGLSFTTISSTGPNAAVIHYSPQHGEAATVDINQIYLCDSGGQYSDGTTDVTRTLHFGRPSKAEIEAFTWVLKGHIAIDTVIFPKGTTGFQLDTLARTALWRQGLDYNHGTGHGIGSFLNVHEGPQGIAARIGTNRVALVPGMILSNEPGYYEDGKYGIRIESVVIVRQVKPPNDFLQKGWLGFERVTMTPIQTKLIDVSLLTNEERDWVNAYHREVLEKVRPLLAEDERAVRWLEHECKSI